MRAKLGRDSRAAITRPGSHSHNAIRLAQKHAGKNDAPFRRLRISLFIVGLMAVGYYAYTLSDQYVYQAYENWAFNQQIAGHSNVAFTVFLSEKTHLRLLAGSAAKTRAVSKTESPRPTPARFVEGDLLGRVSIERLGLSAMVREGVSAATLQTAVGHVPTTALPGQPGNFAIAAHRDTLFRALKDY